MFHARVFSELLSWMGCFDRYKSLQPVGFLSNHDFRGIIDKVIFEAKKKKKWGQMRSDYKEGRRIVPVGVAHFTLIFKF